MSLAQMQVLKYVSDKKPVKGEDVVTNNKPRPSPSPAAAAVSTPSKPPMNPLFAHLNTEDVEGTPRSSPAGSPAPDDGATPQPGTSGGDATRAVSKSIEGPQPDIEANLPIMPLDQAIVTCVNEAAKGDERKMRDFFGGIMVIGGGSKTYNFNVYLENRLRALQPNLAKDILVGPPPRELDPQVLIWKGGSVFGKLRGTNDSWIGQLEYDRLGARILNYKCMWGW